MKLAGFIVIVYRLFSTNVEFHLMNFTNVRGEYPKKHCGAAGEKGEGNERTNRRWEN